jgi:hypothetical protein
VVAVSSPKPQNPSLFDSNVINDTIKIKQVK